MKKHLLFLSVTLVYPALITIPGFAEQMQPKAPFVLGYADQVSYAPGEEVSLQLSSSEKLVSVSISRVSAKRDHIFDAKNIACSPQPIPDRASSHGCNWPSSYKFTIPMNWHSGYYEATLQTTGAKSTLFFIVRAAKPGTKTKILIQLATNTYTAYTNWGGHSLYSYHDRDGLQGHRVSFDRPLRSQFGKWELPFVAWAESNGYVLDYAANNDLEFHPEILKHYNLVLSLGHDEYWSTPMRDNLEQYIADGGNVAFMSGNTCCWQVRSERNGRDLTCWKQWYNLDPHYRTTDHKLLSTLWGHHLIGRPENELTGVGFLWGGYHKSHGQFMDGKASFKVHRPDHWLFEGTDLKRDERFGGKDTIVGYECDGCEMEWKDGLPYPTYKDGTPKSFTILATCPARWAPGDSYWYDRFPKDRIGAAVLGTYTHGGTVVTTGTTDWSHGLKGKDPAVIQITKNILNRLGQPPRDNRRSANDQPLSPEEALATIQVNNPELEVQLVAAEPLVMDPVAFDWDPQGRLWVVEMRDYPKGFTWNKPDDPHDVPGGRIKILTDTDQDGQYDKATIFLDNLVCPTGIKVWKDGALITAAPDIFFARDTNGDGKANKTEVWFTGFARSNQQHRVNGFAWGLDNWLHIANGDGGGKIRSTRTGKVLDIRGHDLRINPFTHEHELLSGQTQHGRFRDDWGNWFGCNNSNPLWHYPLNHKLLSRNPHVQAPKAAVTVPRIPGAAPVYPISQTQKRFNQPDRANRFTSVCGPNFYRDTLLGQQYYGNVFICEPVHNLVSRQILTQKGITFRSHRAKEEEQSEFLASTDNWFRPVSVKTGPDGALWVADMYRAVIEHSEWIPLDRQKEIDIRAGHDQGRIYRIIRKGIQHPKPTLGEPTEELSSQNGARRDLAHQMILWGKNIDSWNINRIARNHENPKALVHALGILHTEGEFRRDTLEATDWHLDPNVIRAGLRIIAQRQKQYPHYSASRILEPFVAIEMANATSSSSSLGTILGVHRNDPYVTATALSSVSKSNIDELLTRLTLPKQQPQTLQTLANMAVAWDSRKSIDLLLASLEGTKTLEPWKLAIMTALAKDAQARKALSAHASQLPEKANTHSEAIRLLALLSKDPNDLTKLLAPNLPPKLQDTVFDALGEQASKDTPRLLLKRWPNLTPKSRKRATQLLISREPWKAELKKALENGKIKASQLDTNTLNRLEYSKASLTPRDQVVKAHKSVLQLEGNATAGRTHFKNTCSACHIAEGQGNSVGPDIAALTDRSKDSLLTAILDPNRAIEDKYVSYEIQTNSGQTHVGMIESESTNHLTLRLPDGSSKNLPRQEIQKLISLGISLMPNGLENTLSPQNLADLLAYLATLGKPKLQGPNLHSAMSARVRPGKDGIIELRAKKCRLSGNRIEYMADFDAIGWWTSSEDRAEWTIVLDRPGEYKVEWEWSVSDKASGNNWQLLTNGEKVLSGKVHKSGGWEDFKTEKIGNISLSAADTKIVLKSEGELKQALMDLRVIRFIPEDG